MYCVYLTLYFGDKLPKRYIGSTSIKRIDTGYNGSIKSKEYKKIFLQEQQENKHLFRTRVLSRHNTRLEALIEELRLQTKYNVVKSNQYMNKSLASVNGYFGRDISGPAHPMYGKTLSGDARAKISNTLKKKYANGSLVSPFKTVDNKGERNGFYGKAHTPEALTKMRKPKSRVPRYMCPHCSKLYDRGNLKQHMMRNGYPIEEIDLIKPEGWTAPSHEGNHSIIGTL